MAHESVLMAAMDTFNQRGAAATGMEEGEHSFADRQQWALVATGLDVDQDRLLALALTLTDCTAKTAGENPDIPTGEIIADGMRQMFIIGALHEQERARREREAAGDAA